MVACSCSPTINLPGARMPPQENEAVLYHMLNSSVALVDVREDGPFVYCSGVYLEGGKVLTAAHCVEDKDIVLIGTFLDYIMSQNEFRRLVVYQIEDYDTTQDLALLSLVSGQIPSFHTESKITEWDPYYGQKVYLIGNPVSLHFTLTTGIISFPKRIMDNGQVYTQSEVKLFFGNSGGPLFAEDGEVIGIASFMWSRQSHLGGFTHVDSIREFVND